MSTSPAILQNLIIQMWSSEGNLILVEPTYECFWKCFDIYVKYGIHVTEDRMFLSADPWRYKNVKIGGGVDGPSCNVSIPIEEFSWITKSVLDGKFYS